MLPSLTPLKINVIVHYLERSNALAIDSDGYIIWTRNSAQDDLTFGEVADMSSELREFLEKRSNIKDMT
jgi:hypothetical protein